MGFKVTEFLLENFKDVMEIDFTAKFEKYLDKIAAGKAKWFNILDTYFKMFNPMVVKLTEDSKHITNLNSTDKLLGVHPELNLEIFAGVGKYGPYVKILTEKIVKIGNFLL